ncbi:CHASE3 domain-containing protein [Sandarakinorhabdus sp. DWP1-3-1]|uniref:CHASE3 domain-containing protein n=1 Tax=Sandarakinorhabdus sp. DWP1-3-1 TaxID=2804627 RepID=UPI003CF46B1C
MPERSNRIALRSIVIGPAVVVTAAIVGIWLTQAQRDAGRWVSHSISVQLGVARFEKSLSQYESAYRGYLIRPLPSLLSDMDRARRDLQDGMATLQMETADNPAQRRHVEDLKQPLAEKIELGDRWVAAQKQGQLDAALAQFRSERGRDLTRLIEAKAALVTAEEDRLLGQRQAMVQRLSELVILGLVLAILAIVVTAIYLVRDARARIVEAVAARDAAVQAREQVIEEVRRREAAEGQVRQMQKMESVGQLTGGIAHDFNNMLAIIIGSLDLAIRRFSDPARVKKSIAAAREGAERAAVLTARLLAFSRQQPLAPVAVEVNRLVSGMSELLIRTLGEQIHVETVLAGGLWPTFVDQPQLESALLNLAVNARDAMAEQDGGKLTIETMNAHLDEDYARTRAEVEPGQYVLICVSDTGAGMPPEVVARAFDPFFTTKEVGKGTGLGLSQVFGFVKQSGGHVAIYSEPGQGTTIKLYLPRYMGAAIVPGAVMTPDAMPPGRREEVVLVVEDEARMRELSSEALSELGYTVLSAAGPLEALAMLRDNPGITLLFTDVVMPDMSGRKLADEALQLCPDLKVVFTTGYTRNAVVHNGMLDAGVAFLPKPFTIAQLASKVRAVLDGGGQNR